MDKTLNKKFIKTTMITVSILLFILVGSINAVNMHVTVKRNMNDLKMISSFYDKNTVVPGDTDPMPEKPDRIDKSQQPEKAEGSLPSDKDNKPADEMLDASTSENAIWLNNDFFGNSWRNDYDTFMASNFFYVVLDAEGKCEKVDVSRTSQLDEDEAVELANSIIEDGKDEGTTGSYMYIVSRQSEVATAETEDSSVGPYADSESKSEASEITRVVFLDCTHSHRQMRAVLFISLIVAVVCWIAMLGISTLLSKKATKPIAENFERQKQFVTDAGHEIKTPLAIIQTNAEAMELYEGDNKWLRNIKLQVGRLNGLTQDLLLLAKLDENMPVADIEIVDSRKVLDETLEAFSNNLSLKNMTVDVNAEATSEKVCIGTNEDCTNDGAYDAVPIHIRRSDIEKLFGILIDNAIKYGNEGSSIGIRIAKHKNGMKFSIENECIITPEIPANKLFERFFRCDKSRSESKGNGIGLSIAKSIAEAYGGEIKAEYVGDNAIRFTAIF